MFNCLIISKENKIYFKDLKNITLPTFLGQIQILHGHAEAYILLKNGEIKLQKNNQPLEIIQTKGGICHFKSDLLTIID